MNLSNNTSTDLLGMGLSASYLSMGLILGLISIVALWRIFTKAGHSGIKSIIPLYNLYTLFKIAWGNGWIFLLLLIPIVNIVIQIIFCSKLAKSFGKGSLFTLGLVFFYPIFVFILGFDQSKYMGPTR